MHVLIFVSSLALVALGGYATLRLLQRVDAWDRRRELQLLVLVAPIATLGLGVGGLHHFSGQMCLLGTPPWDYALGIALPLTAGGVALGALGLGGARLALLDRAIRRGGAVGDPDLQRWAAQLANHLGAGRPRVLVSPCDRPLAVTGGLLRPTVVISRWMLVHLDGRELEAVLAHELAHAARRDSLVVWLGTILRDAFCYLPTSWAAYRQLQQEKELACDDLAVAVTGRPLALASALAKTWQESLTGPEVGRSLAPLHGGAQPLADSSQSAEGRIRRLLAHSPPTEKAVQASGMPLGLGALGLTSVLLTQGATVLALLAPMGCSPLATLARLL